MIGWIYLLLTVGVLGSCAGALALDRRPARLFRWGKRALLLLWAVTIVVLVIRFTRGLGAVTGMSDGFPWGVWIGLLQSGVALAAGGFVTAACVHIFFMKRFEPILRPMVLTAFLGYSFVAATLFIEVGRPYRLWHPLVMWQDTSIMFEVAWCVTLYMTVLLVEFSPVFFERVGMKRVVHVLHVAAIPVVILGVILSTLHQSSMGSMFLILPQKMHPLWSSPLLPVFFLISSIAAGLCMPIIESFFSFRVFGQELAKPLLINLGRAASAVLFLLFILRLADVTARGTWASLGQDPAFGILFLAETVGGALLPAILFIWPHYTDRIRGLLIPALLASFGVILSRLNVSWFSLIPTSKVRYFPTWMELSISLSLLTMAIALFGLAVRTLPVFPPRPDRDSLPLLP